ncbi:hypothetical protein IFR05_014810 [Cadophora sp. M221]|nr:hypothetical protein IFR05_014810 [Cadophora sp. M221]
MLLNDHNQKLPDEKQEIESSKKTQEQLEEKLEDRISTMQYQVQKYPQEVDSMLGSHSRRKDLDPLQSTTHSCNGTPPSIFTIPTINVQSEGKENANLTRLPDMRSFWGNEGWSSREVIPTIFSDRDLAAEDIHAVYYILKTKNEHNLLPNQHFEAGVWGDVCIMR